VIASLRRHPLVVLLLASAVGLGLVLPGAFAGEKAAPGAVRSALAQTSKVQGAPQRTMVLSRVVIDPGAKLALHHHEGTQIARIEAGVLTYTVERGSAVVREGEADQQPRVVRTIAAGQTGRVRPGQWMVEQPSDIHRAANRGTVPVVIYLATLLKTGAPPSTPVVLDAD
jgi:quercetin dioxygenase-like cupin family protein